MSKIFGHIQKQGLASILNISQSKGHCVTTKIIPYALFSWLSEWPLTFTNDTSNTFISLIKIIEVNQEIASAS